MPIAAPRRKELISGNRRHETDTGSPEVQISLLTERIESLSGHLKDHDKDFHGRRGLMLMVSKRNRLLKYISRIDHARYAALIAKLGLRK